MTVYIDPRCRVNYASYYILGLMQTYGSKFVKFEVDRFRTLAPLNTERAQANGMCFMLTNEHHGETQSTTFYIDFHDADRIDFDIYNCVDVYAKLNLSLEEPLETLPKIVATGPSFAVDIWSWLDTVRYAVNQLLLSNKDLQLPYISVLKDYFYLKWRRVPLEMYLQPAETDMNYIFAMSTLWFDEQTASTTNALRCKFLRFARKHFQRVEGGFYFVKNKIAIQHFPTYNRYLEEYKDSICHKRVNMASYIEKTKRSTIVFNTPSVSGCLGWKLGEYLCMGKAIVSYPLNKVMPGCTKEMNFAHFVETDEQLKEAIILLKHDEAYRKKLEQNATTYFHKYLTPEASIARIVNHNCGQKAE